MKNLFRYLAIAFLGAVLGAVFTWLALRPRIPNAWFQISKNEKTTLTNQVFVESDIPVAEVLSLRGRACIVDHSARAQGPVSVGYILDLELSRIDPKKIPKKYATDKPIVGGKLIEPAIIVPTYNVKFVFSLLDKNGFVIYEIESPEHSVTSGKVNSIKGQTESGIQRSKANLVKEILVWTHFVLTHGVRSD